MHGKVIGIVMSSYDKEPLLSIYNGIVSASREQGYITHSNMIFLSRQATDEFNNGESHIFEITDYSNFDGLVVLLNSISSDRTKKYILEKITQLDIPIVAIDCNVPGAVKIRTDNYIGTKNLLNHLVKDHGCRKINYISGPKNNDESNERLMAYVDGMVENGLDTDGRIFMGTFYVGDGEAAYKYFSENEKTSDYDAIMCGNDFAAFSLMCELKKQGISVPEQVKVAGFDNIREADSNMLMLTSVYKNGEKLGNFAVDLLKKMFAGETVDKEYTHPCEIVYRNSCGCVPDSKIKDELDSTYYERYSSSRLLKNYIKSAVEKGLACESFDEFVAIINNLIKQINPSYFEMSIYTEFGDVFPLEKYEHRILKDGDGRTKEFAVAFAYGDKASCDQYLSSPLHYGERAIGFLFWGNTKFPTTQDLYWDLLTSANLILYALHNKLKLNDLYREDYLTGVYNRFGLKYYWDLFEEACQSNRTELAIIFADVNNLKRINDTLGHEVGDHAIKQIAEPLKKRMSNTLKVARIGGDEFIVICLGKTAAETQALIAEIEGELDEFGYVENSDIKLSASFGYYVKQYDEDICMDDCIKKADEAMYVNKLIFHSKDNKTGV